MSKGKEVFLIALAMAALMFSSMACNIEPGDGQTGKAVTDGLEIVHDAEFALKDAVDATGEGLEFETHESPLSALWDLAEEIAQ